jgi:hypothetical protein
LSSSTRRSKSSGILVQKWRRKPSTPKEGAKKAF